MPFTPIADTIRVVLHWATGAQNVLHVKPSVATAPFDLTELQLALAAVSAHWQANMMPLFSTQASIQRITARDMDDETGLIAETSASIAGEVAAEPFPDNVAIVVSWRTALGGRRHRGRTYLQGIPAAFQDDDSGGYIDIDQAEAIALGAVDLITDLDASDYPLAVASGLLGTSTLVVNPVVDRRIDSQVRRLPRR